MRAVVQALKRYEEEVERWAKRGVAETVLTIHSQAVALAPTDTSALKDSIKYSITNGGLKGVVQVTSDYAIFVEFGTGIYAVGGNGRKTPWVYRRADGKYITTQGNQPQPFWFPAIRAGERYFTKYFN